MTDEEARPLVDWMRRHDIPVTRENYLALAYPEGLPRPWTMEHEMELPAELQLWRRVRPLFADEKEFVKFRDSFLAEKGLLPIARRRKR